MKTVVTGFATQNTKLIFVLLALLVTVTTAFIPTLTVDTDPENMLPVEQPNRVFHDQIKKDFLLFDLIVVGIVNEKDELGIYNPTTLSSILNLTKEIQKIEGVVSDEVMSLPTVDNIEQVGIGTISFNWMLKDAPISNEAPEQIKQAISRLPLLMNTLVAETGKAVGIYVPIKSKDESFRISQEIQALVESLNIQDEVHITGLTVAEDTFGVEMFIQMGISAPVAALVIFILMWYFFRSFLLITAPMIIAMSTVLIAMGTMIGMGFTVHIMSSMIPIFLMPIAVVDSVHLLSEFSDLYEKGMDKKKLIKQVTEHLFTPMLYTSITSAIGFASLMFTPIPPVQIFGAFVAGGIFLAFLLTVVFVPAYIVALKPETIVAMKEAQKKVIEHEQNGLLSRFLQKLKTFAINHSWGVVALMLVVVTVSIIGIQKIQINDNPVRWFKDSHPIRVADKVLNGHFAGTYNAFLVLENENLNNDPLQIAEQLLAKTDDSIKAPLQQFIVSRKFDDISVIEDFLSDQAFNANEDTVDAWESLLEEFEQQKVAFFKQPKNLAKVADLQQFLAGLDTVGKSNALPDLVKTINRELRSGDELDYRLPQSAAGVAEAILSFQSSHRPNDLWHMVSPDFNRVVVWLQLSSGDNQAMSEVVKATEDYLIKNPLPNGVNAQWGGLTYINVVWQEAMVKGMVESLFSAFVFVFVMMVVLFRSVIFGLIAMLPLSVTITGIYGLIGWYGKDYDMPIAVLSALTLGLSVDFAIHFIERIRVLYKETQNWQETISQMFTEPARAISRNAIVIAIGFTPLLLAPLVPYVTVGFFLATIMALSALTTLVVLPAILNLVRPLLFKNG